MVEDDGTKPVSATVTLLEWLLTLGPVDLGEGLGPIEGGHEHGCGP